MIILVTFPRSGSSWVQKFVNKYNTINYNAKDLYDYFGKKVEGTVNQKIDFLNTERKSGQEYSVKYFTYHKPVNTQWFKDFYKDSAIIKLNRKDKYRAFLSYIAQYVTGWRFHNPKKIGDVNLFSEVCKELIAPEEAMKEWFERYKSFVEYNNHVEEWVYEELSHNYLCNKLNISNVDIRDSYSSINYEKRIININEVKKYFENAIRSI